MTRIFFDGVADPIRIPPEINVARPLEFLISAIRLNALSNIFSACEDNPFP